MSTPTMTIDEVLSLLRTPRPLVWRLEGALLRTYRGADCLCPITAACLLVTGVRYDLAAWKEAAQQLGLSREDARALQDAADHAEALYAPALRPQLLRLLSPDREGA